MPAARLKEVEQAYGLRTCADGLLSDSELRRCFNVQEVGRYDWAHTFLADGVVTDDAWTLIDRCEDLGVIRQRDTHDFLREDWVLPQSQRRAGSQLWRVFDMYGAKSNRTHEALKCGASELLSLYPMLRHFFECRVPRSQDFDKQLEVFLKICDAVDNILGAKRGDIPMASAGQELRRILASHMAPWCVTAVYL